MGPAELLRWQWDGYPKAHGNRANLLLHLLTAPFYWVGSALLVAALFRLDWRFALMGLGCILVTLVTQGFGHKRLEANPPAPFTSPWNFIARLFLEQWINFPRFVVTGGWARNFAAGRDGR